MSLPLHELCVQNKLKVNSIVTIINNEKFLESTEVSSTV